MSKPQIGSQTPWGVCDYADEKADDVVFVGTPSHGGFWLGPERRQVIAEKFPNYKNFLNSLAWWEEDCDAAVVMVAFPELFPDVSENRMRQIAASIRN